MSWFYRTGSAEKKKPKKKRKKRQRCEEEEEEELTVAPESLYKNAEIPDGQKHKTEESGNGCQSLLVDLKDRFIAQMFLCSSTLRSKRPAGDAGGGGDLPGPKEETEDQSGSRSGKTSSKQL